MDTKPPSGELIAHAIGIFQEAGLSASSERQGRHSMTSQMFLLEKSQWKLYCRRRSLPELPSLSACLPHRKFAAREDVVGRMPQQVRRRILPLVERRRPEIGAR